MMRLFLAVLFNSETERRLLAVQNRLRQIAGGNFSRPENLHLTLAFLGEVPAERMNAVRRAMQQTRVRPLSLNFDRVGSFRGGEVWWIGTAQNPELLTLQRELSENLALQGFAPESRAFSPHITLARQVRLHGAADPAAVLGEPFGTHTDTVSLMLSQRVGGRLVYTQQYAVSAQQQKGESE